MPLTLFKYFTPCLMPVAFLPSACLSVESQTEYSHSSEEFPLVTVRFGTSML